MLATLARYLDPWEAHILRGRLVAEGVPATVSDDQHIIANWPQSLALGGAALQVPLAHWDQASGILQAHAAGEFEQDVIAEYPEVAPICPDCGAGQPRRTVPSGQLALNIITFFLAGAPFPTYASMLGCTACGLSWHEPA